MKAGYHVIVSAGAAVGFQSLMNSWPATAACFFSGILIDLDHHVEYHLIKKKIPFRFKDLENFCYFNKSPNMYLIFHAYEFLLIFWLLVGLLHLNIIYVGIATGLTLHMFFDQFTNPIKPLFYFITYRIYHRFKKVNILSTQYFLFNQSREE